MQCNHLATSQGIPSRIRLHDVVARCPHFEFWAPTKHLESTRPICTPHDHCIFVHIVVKGSTSFPGCWDTFGQRPYTCTHHSWSSTALYTCSRAFAWTAAHSCVDHAVLLHRPLRHSCVDLASTASVTLKGVVLRHVLALRVLDHAQGDVGRDWYCNNDAWASVCGPSVPTVVATCAEVEEASKNPKAPQQLSGPT